MKKIIQLAVVTLLFASILTACSSTRNAIGIDTINSFIRTGKWTTLTKEVYAPGSNTAIKTNVLTDGQYLEFKSDDKAHIFSSSGTELSSVNYRFVDTKTMLYDGLEFKVQENFVSTISVMTLVNESATGKTVYIFRR